MLFRFSLYGFLKNQQYYAPFLILAFREKGLAFFAIGSLMGFRELCVQILEVPTGAIADLYGRRRSMVISFCAYIVSFAIFALSGVVWHLFAAMLFFAIGEAFRTGTHKAMILDWLRLQGREDEKTKTYGYTRSWAKAGSALSVLIAAALVYYTGRYSDIFWLCIIPYAAGIINFLGYPAELDGRPEKRATLRNLAGHLVEAFRKALGNGRLRRVLAESMAYDSVCKVVGDYLQPVVKQMAIALPFLLMISDKKRTAILAGCVYFVLHVISSIASRKSHVVATRLGGESRAARVVWLLTAGVLAGLALALTTGIMWPAVAAFVVLEVVRNVWRPVAITRIDNETDATMGATMLSVDSQAKAAATMLLAPAVGYAVDTFTIPGSDQPAFWVVGAAGVVIAALGAMAPAMPSPDPEQVAPPPRPLS